MPLYDERLVNALPALVLVASDDGRVDSCNRRWTDYTGMSPEEARGGWAEAIHPDERSRVAEFVRQLGRASGSGDAELRLRRADGAWRRFMLRLAPYVNETESSRSVLLFFDVNASHDAGPYDIEHRIRRADDAQGTTEGELSLIIETIPAFVWCASPGGAITYINQRLLDRLGTTLDHAMNGWHELVHPDDRDSIVRAWAQAVSTGDAYSRPFRIRHGDQAYHWVQAMAQLGRDESGSPTRWYGLLIDIDEQRRAEEALKETRARLARASRVATVAELSASIAHEINQPLVAIVSNAQACVNWLAAVPPNLAKARRAAEIIVRDGGQAGETISRLRKLFQRQSVQRVPLSINQLVRDVVELVLAEAGQRQITVETALEPTILSVPGDPVQLQQVALNLLNNALDAVEGLTDRERLVVVRSSQIPDAVLIEVEDSGIGLSDPVKVFEPFFTTKAEGLGVGLAICRWVIEGHGGKLWAENHARHGASFFFTLPLDSRA
jgi:PAS domain S-box-containing protein